MDIESKTRIFCNAWQSISVIYEDYARKSGISYNSLYILNAILFEEYPDIKKAYGLCHSLRMIFSKRKN